jgi:eukaryotic-like serine/threonine-protein kinase
MANSSARAALDVGSVIADTYKIEALLGRGGMGAVFLASHQRLAGKHVAIKILHTDLADGDIVARFKREAEIAAKLNHPNIVGVIDYNVTPDGTPYLVLDYLEGETLAGRIARGPMPLDQVLSIVRQVGSALAAAHRAGIVHRDLKPQNIFLVPAEVAGREVEIAKVLDFGISKIRGSQTVQTQDSVLLGTPQYMSPEQAMGQHANVDERTDVFAFGAIVYEMLSGQPAFPGTSIPEVVFKVVYEQPAPLAAQAPSLPPAIVSAVMQAMAKPAEERFPGVAGFVEALTGQPLTVTRGQPPALDPAAEAPSASRRVATGEALARTMARGEYDGLATHPLVATAAPGAASTPAGLAAPAVPASFAPPAVPAAPTIDLHPRQPRPDPSQTPRRAAGLFAVIAIAGAGLAAGAVYLAMRSGDAPRPEHALNGPNGTPSAEPAGQQHPGSATTGPARPPAGDPASPQVTDPKAIDSKATDPKATDPKATDPKATDPKATKVIDPKATDPKTIDSKATDPAPTDPKAGKKPTPPQAGAHDAKRPPPTPTGGDDATDGDDEIRQKLQEAATALARHDYDLAERLATMVINSPASPKQRASARVVHGTVQCVARNDQEAAQIDLRNLDGFRALKAQLITVCKQHGILTP